MNKQVIRESLVRDKRNGCVAIYQRSRKDESNGLNKNQDRIIAYSDKNARYNGAFWEMDEATQQVFTDMVLAYNKAYCTELDAPAPQSAREVAALCQAESEKLAGDIFCFPTRKDADEWYEKLKPQEELAWSEIIEAYAESRVQEALEKMEIELANEYHGKAYKPEEPKP